MISPFSVHAASVPGQYDVVDLLATGFFPEGDLVVTKSASTYSFTWDVTASSSVAFVYLNIYAPSVPSSVTFNGITGTRVYSGAFYQYKFSVSKVLSTCTVKVNFSSTASRTVSIGYAVGTVSGQAVFDIFTVKSKGVNASSYTIVDNAKIPYTGLYSSNVTSDLVPAQISCKFELVFKSPLASADYATFHLIVPSVASAPSVSPVSVLPFFEEPSFFLGTSASHTYPLDIISVESYHDPVRGLGSVSSAWHYVVTVDVSGYKLDSLDIVCDFSIFGIKKGDTTSYSFGFELLSSCVGLNPDSGSPFRAFIPWLNNRFTDVKSWFNSLGSTISTQFSSLKTSLSGWFSSLESKIQAVVNPPKSQEQQDAQDNVDQQVSDMEQFEQSQFGEIQNGTSQLQTDVSAGVNSFVPALAFIGKYVSAVGAGIQDYIVVFMMPIYLGIFFFICNRASGVTHISVFRRKGD